MRIHQASRTLTLVAVLIGSALTPSCSHPAATTAPAPTMASAVSTPAGTALPATTPTTSDPFGLPPGTARWIDLTPGQCLADPPPTDPAVVTVTVVDCAKSHLAEVVARVKVPVDAAVTGTASSTCESGFTQYTGKPSTGGAYTITYLIDSDQDRTSNNPLPSTVICLVQGAQGQALTGSAHR